MVFEPNASASLSQTCWAIERRSATPGNRRIRISRMPSSVAVREGRSPQTSTSRAAGSNSSSPITIRGPRLTDGLRCSARSLASSSPKSNGLTR